jgi:hypothetical protein
MHDLVWTVKAAEGSVYVSSSAGFRAGLHDLRLVQDDAAPDGSRTLTARVRAFDGTHDVVLVADPDGWFIGLGAGIHEIPREVYEAIADLWLHGWSAPVSNAFSPPGLGAPRVPPPLNLFPDGSAFAERRSIGTELTKGARPGLWHALKRLLRRNV